MKNYYSPPHANGASLVSAESVPQTAEEYKGLLYASRTTDDVERVL